MLFRSPQMGKAAALFGLVTEKKPDMLVVDARESIGRETVARLGEKIGVVAVLDDGSDKRLAATHAYYPPVPQVENLSWKNAKTAVRTGWEWALLGFDPAKYAARLRDGKDRPTVVVSMGGSDPLDLKIGRAHV